MRQMLDLERDVKGATPEIMARALLEPLGPRLGAKAVVRDKIAVQ